MRRPLREELPGLTPEAQLDSAQLDLLDSHFELLRRWNRRLNLTSEEEPEWVSRHYAECLRFALMLGEFCRREAGGGCLTVADVGSGAGFPGVLVAAAHPGWTVHLIESHRRKAVFLTEATRSFRNIRVLPSRAEAVNGPFTAVISRAVRPREVVSQVPRLAGRVGLMLSLEQLGELSDFVRWEEPLSLAEGTRRVAVFGRYALA